MPAGKAFHLLRPQRCGGALWALHVLAFGFFCSECVSGQLTDDSDAWSPPRTDDAESANVETLATEKRAAEKLGAFEANLAARRARRQHQVMTQFMHNFAKNMRRAVLEDSKGDMPEEERQRMLRQLQRRGDESEAAQPDDALDFAGAGGQRPAVRMLNAPPAFRSDVAAVGNDGGAFAAEPVELAESVDGRPRASALELKLRKRRQQRHQSGSDVTVLVHDDMGRQLPLLFSEHHSEQSGAVAKGAALCWGLTLAAALVAVDMRCNFFG
mmetsp:Transcript_34794/g.95983  ORF Transcript_34794/g.95983 Transcript_34794/m.95983 type:complete len:270 (+) Transcript_34794:62-871(+)